MGHTVDAIAEELRAAAAESPEAFTARLAMLWADEVGTAHEPPHPIDGPRTRDQQVELHRNEDAAFRQAMADYRQDDVKVSARGDCIELATTITGTGSEGTMASLPVRWRFTLSAGRIHHVVTVVDPADTRPMNEILNKAGIHTPD